MRIRRHLFFYNTISVLVALVAMLVVNGAATHAIGRYYQRQAEEMFHELQGEQPTVEGTIWLDRATESWNESAESYRPARSSLDGPGPRWRR